MNKKCTGAISIFMIIITLSCFMLGGIFIDATRILAARNKVKLSMDAAARSAMSYYDEDLVSEYGLYGLSSKDIDKNFKKYFKANMLKAEYDGINLFEYTINDEENTLTGVESFLDSMPRQIEEYSKYRAPVTTTFAVVNKIKDAFSIMGSKASGMKDAANAAEGLQEQFKNSSDALKNSMSTIKNNIKNQMLTSVKNGVTSIVNGGIEFAVQNRTKTVDDAIKSSMESVNAEIEKMEEELEKLKEKKKLLENENKDMVDPSAGDFIEYADDAEKSEAEEAKKKGEENEREIQKEIDELESEIQALKGETSAIKNNLENKSNEIDAIITEWETAENSLRDAEIKLGQAKDKLETVKKEKGISQLQSTLTSYQKSKTESENVINELMLIFQSQDVKNDIEEYQKAIEEKDDEKKEELKIKYEEMDNEKILEIFEHYDEIYELEKLIETENAKIAAANVAIQNEQANVEQWESEVERCKENIRVCKNRIEGKNSEMQTEIKKLNDLTKPNVKEKAIDDIKKSAKETLEKDDGAIGGLYDVVDQITKKMPGGDYEEKSSNEKGLVKLVKEMLDEWDNLFEILGDGEKLADQCMYIDYIMGKCTYLTSHSGKEHHFKWGEVEYILYGNKSQSVNIVSTIGAIYSMRFMINFIDYMITTPGGLISRASVALTRGLTSSLRDLQMMIVSDTGDAEGCYISPSLRKAGIKLKLTYSDHLRILLLKKLTVTDMSRIKNTIDATLQYQNDESLDELNYTNDFKASVKADIRVGVNLVMIPVFTDILPLDRYFDDGKFYIEDSVSFSY